MRFKSRKRNSKEIFFMRELDEEKRRDEYKKEVFFLAGKYYDLKDLKGANLERIVRIKVQDWTSES